MVNKEITVVAKIERDAQNFFFAKMLYGFEDSENGLQTVYGIEDENLIDNIVALSYMALNTFKCGINVGSTIIIYDTKSQDRHSGYHTDYTAPDRIIVGTMPMPNFEDINYLIRMISYMIEKEKMGDFSIRYKDKEMTVDEFYEFQKELSIYTI